MLIQPDGKIILAGQVLNGATLHWEIGIARYNPDGSPDETWDEDGIVITGSQDSDFTIRTVALQVDRKVIVGGYFGTAQSNNLFAIGRYHPGGGLDETFGEDGIVLGSYGHQNNQINALLLQPDGQILIAGTSLQGSRDLFAMARLEPDGRFDDTFGEGGVVTPAIDQNDGINSMALHPDGKIIVAGDSFNGQRFSVVVARMETGLMTSVDVPVEAELKASVFPNPASDQLHVTYRLNKSGLVHLVLFDQTGRIVFEMASPVKQDAGDAEISFELPKDIQNGMYTVRLMCGDEVGAVRVVVMR
jgi:uncharacterized delta-60 repeat protein